jgi:CubicO group peptidase (beta-lactamase class C family)
MMSVTKTLTGVATARALQLGLFELTTPVVDILKNVDKKKLAKGADKITIHDCLNMMSGVVPTDEMVWSDFTAQDILSKSEEIKPNTVCNYQDADPQLMWFSIDSAYEGGALKFLEKEFFGPLGIKSSDYDWLDTKDQFFQQVGSKTSGVPKGGTGAAIRPRDMLRVGNLMVRGGKLKGKQFLSEDYMKVATSNEDTKTKAIVASVVGDYRYHWHHGTVEAVEGKQSDDDIHYIYSAGGMGQFIMLVPDHEVVMVATATDDNMMDPTKTLFREVVAPAFLKASDDA